VVTLLPKRSSAKPWSRNRSDAEVVYSFCCSNEYPTSARVTARQQAMIVR